MLKITVSLLAVLLIYLSTNITFIKVVENGETYAIQKSNYIGFTEYLDLYTITWHSKYYHNGETINLFTDDKNLIISAMLRYNGKLTEEKKISQLKRGFE